MIGQSVDNNNIQIKVLGFGQHISMGLIKGEVTDDMIKWKKKGTELYQNLPKECRELMKECDPLSKLEKNRKEKQKITFQTWKKTK